MGEHGWGVDRVEESNLQRFLEFSGELYEIDADRVSVSDLASLEEWKRSCPEQYWEALAIFSRIDLFGSWQPILIGPDKLRQPNPESGPWWFGNARLNLARDAMWHSFDKDREHVATDSAALITFNPGGGLTETSWDDLRERIREVHRWLLEHGAVPGNVVLSRLADPTNALVGFLAAASVGVAWASPNLTDSALSPDFLFCEHDNAGASGIKAVRHFHSEGPKGPAPTLAQAQAITLNDLPFNHPLVASSFRDAKNALLTVIHPTGGLLLQLLEMLLLRIDLQPTERVLFAGLEQEEGLILQSAALVCGATVVQFHRGSTENISEQLVDLSVQHAVLSEGNWEKFSQWEHLADRENNLRSINILRSVDSGGRAPFDVGDHVYQWVKPAGTLCWLIGAADETTNLDKPFPAMPLRVLDSKGDDAYGCALIEDEHWQLGQ